MELAGDVGGGSNALAASGVSGNGRPPLGRDRLAAIHGAAAPRCDCQVEADGQGGVMHGSFTAGSRPVFPRSWVTPGFGTGPAVDFAGNGPRTNAGAFS